MITNISYDEEKARTVESGYLPDVDETLESGKGICFDYAALNAMNNHDIQKNRSCRRSCYCLLRQLLGTSSLVAFME